uniref:Uncharacterized protein n=1 Tax=Angiostrongylus cantonensis TaxID=6313 RepID=A0A0K0D9W5_ANGCA
MLSRLGIRHLREFVARNVPCHTVLFRMTNSDLCTRRRWMLKIALNGLHLRRVELARDCVQMNTKNAKISESTLTSDEVQAFSAPSFAFNKFLRILVQSCLDTSPVTEKSTLLFIT